MNTLSPDFLKVLLFYDQVYVVPEQMSSSPFLFLHLCPGLNFSAKFIIFRDSRNFRSFVEGLPQSFAFLRQVSSTALQNFSILVIFAIFPVSFMAFYKPDLISFFAFVFDISVFLLSFS